MTSRSLGLPHRITTLRDLKRFQELDLLAHGLDRWRVHYRYSRPEIAFQRRLRRAEYWQAKRGPIARLVYLFARFLLLQASVRTGISIQPGVCGPGLSVAHYGSVVVNGEAKIGAFCRIHSATNIGAFAGGAPRLADFVYVGPGAAIYGPVEIGACAVIGANAVVGRDVPANSVATGAPAQTRPADMSRTPMPPWIKTQMATLLARAQSDQEEDFR